MNEFEVAIREIEERVLNTNEEVVQWLHDARDKSFDLPTALSLLPNKLNQLEQDDIERGSCQDYLIRLVAQLAINYKVPAECFEAWDT